MAKTSPISVTLRPNSSSRCGAVVERPKNFFAFCQCFSGYFRNSPIVGSKIVYCVSAVTHKYVGNATEGSFNTFQNVNEGSVGNCDCDCGFRSAGKNINVTKDNTTKPPPTRKNAAKNPSTIFSCCIETRVPRLFELEISAMYVGAKISAAPKANPPIILEIYNV